MASGTIKSVVPRSDIVDNLTTNDSTKVLSAAQGKALNDKISTYEFAQDTLANIQSAIVTYAGNMANRDVKEIAFVVSTATGVFANTTYIGTLERISATRLVVNVRQAMNSSVYIIGNYKDGTWSWDRVATKSQIDDLNGKLAVTNWNNQTVANIKSGLIALNNTMEDGEMRQIKFVASAASGVIRANDHYVGFIRRYVGTHFYVDASEAYRNENLILEYANGTWIENVIPADINSNIANINSRLYGIRTTTFDMATKSTITITRSFQHQIYLIFASHYSGNTAAWIVSNGSSSKLNGDSYGTVTCSGDTITVSLTTARNVMIISSGEITYALS